MATTDNWPWKCWIVFNSVVSWDSELQFDIVAERHSQHIPALRVLTGHAASLSFLFGMQGSKQFTIFQEMQPFKNLILW